jgi:ABC-type branched-subunit amino acid transport system ATPase component
LATHNKKLELRNIKAGYNGVPIIKEISLAINPGETVLIVGPNGAGKSTLLKTIFGFLKATEGSIYYNGKCLNPIPPHDRVKYGISYVFQEKRIFTRMSVEDNLKVAFQKNGHTIEKALNSVYKKYPVLKQKKKDKAGWLSGGEQQMLAIGRVLMQKPGIILFDEPSAGLAPKTEKEVFCQIKNLADQGITCILVEHRIEEAMKIADRLIGMKDGQICLDKTCSNFLEDRKAVLELFMS